METNAIILLSSTMEAHNQWVIGVFATLIAGMIFFTLGALLGWSTWRRYRVEADRLESEGEQLMAAYNKRKVEAASIRQRSAQLVEEPLV